MCLSRSATTYSRRHLSALYPGQFMIMEVLLSVAEITLSQCMILVFIAVIIAMHHHRLVSLLHHWNNIDSVSGAFKDACARRVTDLRKVFSYLMFLLTWLRSHGEIALLHAEDLRYF